MTPIDTLWLPILLSSVAVFIVSGIFNTAMPWHKKDFPKLEKQDEILDALRPFNIPPGEHLLPRATQRSEMQSPEYLEKLNKGPVLIMTVWKYGSTPMWMTFVQWFVYCIVTGIFAAYIAGRALPAGAGYLSVFRFTGAAAFLAYSAAIWQMTIWFNKPLKSSLKLTFDGLVYALLTAGTFGWLWPA